MIITIDGYAGSGKTTAARRLADALGFRLLNTGGMYRAVAHLLARHGFDIFADNRDSDAIARLVSAWTFEMPANHVLVNGEDLTDVLASEEAGRGASRVGTFPEVRAKLKAEQRRIADAIDIVCEGRDQGTAVFPDAPAKFFFYATPEIRAARRVAQLQALHQEADFATIVRQIADRDYQDENREIDPLRQAPDALRLDTTDMTMDDVLLTMLKVVRG
jgi:cytidylate kinase